MAGSTECRVKTALQARSRLAIKLARPIDHQRHYFSALLPRCIPDTHCELAGEDKIPAGDLLANAAG